MLPRETWRVAVDALWSNKLRAILTTLGVVIGSACIVLVVTVAVTGRRYVIGQIEGVGANLVYANYEVNPQQAVVRSDEITLADMEAVKNALPNVVAVAATSQGLLRNVVTGGTEHAVTLFGATEGFQVIRNLLILKGRFLDAIDEQSRSKFCLITDELAGLVFPNEDPIGKSLRVGQISFTVVGVFRERVGTFGLSEIQRYTVLVPFSLMQYYTARRCGLGHQPGWRTTSQPPFQDGNVRRAEFERDSGSGAAYRHGADHRVTGNRLHCAHGEWHWHHEHHACDRDGAHPGDRNPQSYRRASPRHPFSISDRGDPDQRRWVAHGSSNRPGYPGDGAPVAAGQSARSRTVVVLGGGFRGGLLHRPLLRLPARR